jgi:hypothetical protein
MIYLITSGEYDDYMVIFATTQLHVAQRICEADPSLNLDARDDLDEIPQRTEVLHLSAEINADGSLNERGTYRHIEKLWNDHALEHQLTPCRVTKYDGQRSHAMSIWNTEASLHVRGTDHDLVEQTYARELAKLVEKRKK